MKHKQIQMKTLTVLLSGFLCCVSGCLEPHDQELVAVDAGLSDARSTRVEPEIEVVDTGTGSGCPDYTPTTGAVLDRARLEELCSQDPGELGQLEEGTAMRDAVLGEWIGCGERWATIFGPEYHPVVGVAFHCDHRAVALLEGENGEIIQGVGIDLVTYWQLVFEYGWSIDRAESELMGSFTHPFFSFEPLQFHLLEGADYEFYVPLADVIVSE